MNEDANIFTVYFCISLKHIKTGFAVSTETFTGNITS